MRKLIAMLLVLCTLLSLSAMASAEGKTPAYSVEGYVTVDENSNRVVTGRDDTSTRQLADCITDQILAIQPDLILDLHEATAWDDGWDNLGSSVIFADLDPIADLIFEMMDLEESPNFFSSPPSGSLNAYFSLECGIPVLTLEAAREASMESRIQFHRQLIEFILTFYGML